MVKKILAYAATTLSLLMPLSAYADVDTLSPYIDGNASGTPSASWATAHDSSGTGVDNTSTTVQISVQKHSNTNFYIARSFAQFEFAMGSVVVDSGSLLLYVTSVTDQSGGARGYLRAYDAIYDNTTAFVSADYSACGDTPLSDSIDLTDLDVSAYNIFPLNAAGIAAFDPNGRNDYCFRIGYDGEDSAMTATAIDAVVIGTIENADVNKYPKLSITSHVPSSSSSSSAATATGTIMLFHTACNDYILNGSGDAVGCQGSDTTIEVGALIAIRQAAAQVLFSTVILIIRWAIEMFLIISVCVFLFRIITRKETRINLRSLFRSKR